MRQVGVAVVGTGWCGGIRAQVCAGNPLVRTLDVCDVNPERLEEIARKVRARNAVADATGTSFPIVRTETTKLVRAGTWPNFTWTKTDWHSGSTPLQETVATITGTLDVDNRLTGRAETLTLRTPGNTRMRSLKSR